MSEAPNAHEQLEQVEHAIHAMREGDLKSAAVPLSIAVMAVIAAVLGSLETTASATALLARSDAAIRQGEASDLWGFFQAKSMKKNMYEIAAGQGGPGAEALKAKATRYAGEESEVEAQARAKEELVHAQEVKSEQAMERHHHLTFATSLVHLAIALASISIVVARRWLWFGALASAAAGVAFALV